ncbi:hypothetical protein MMC14_009334, partial [Varicellaria rhodocarpa]|nr:hypothetical protein [Varicellaria rhodocarpa]
RGHNTDIDERDRPQYLQWMRDLTWAEIRRQCIGYSSDDEKDDNTFVSKDDDDCEVDVYSDVDEYVWPEEH